MIVLGHRGGRGAGWPAENSLEAFQRALDEGADGVELDVRTCASGEPVVLHDPWLPATVGTRGAPSARSHVHAVTRAELPKLGGGERIPDLAAALDLCRGKVVNVELKADVPRRLDVVRAVARVVARARDVELVVSSFDPCMVLACAVAMPRVSRGMLVGPRTPRLGTALPLALRCAVSAAHLEDGLIAPSRVARLRRAGLRVVAWTVNDGARAASLGAFGVGCVITDQPGVVGAFVRAAPNRA